MEESKNENKRFNRVYTIQSYCDTFLGFCPFVYGNKNELRNLLDNNGKQSLRDYALMDLGKIVKDKAKVVLVDVTYVDDESGKIVDEYRWFEVPEWNGMMAQS